MIKVALMLFVIGLQNPSPGNGKDSQPPQNLAANEQANSSTANPAPKPAPISAPTLTNIDAPKSQDLATETRNNHDSKPSVNGASTPEIIMAVTSVIMIFVSSGQLWMYLKQWQAMKKTLSQTARISRKQIKHGENISQRELRAYVSVQNGTIIEVQFKQPEPLPTTFAYQYTINIRNAGQTPAYNITSAFEWMYFEPRDADWPVGEPFELPVTRNSIESSITIASNDIAPITGNLASQREGIDVAERYRKWQQREGVFFIFGKVEYDDIYRRKRRTTKFCHVLRHGSDSKVECQIHRLHNDAD